MKSFHCQISIRCIFVRVGDIDTLNEQYYAELILDASWIDTSFKNSQTEVFNPNVNWTPELQIINGIGQLQDEITYSIRYDQQCLATVTEIHRLKGIFWERMELHHFPIDLQKLSLQIISSRSDSEIKFVKNLRKPSGVNRRIFTDEQEWYLFACVDIETKENTSKHLYDEHHHPIVTCSCYAARFVFSIRREIIL